MTKKIPFFFVMIAIVFTSCKKDNLENVTAEKSHWDAEDYEEAYREIRFNTPEGEKYPGLNYHAEIFNKIIDTESLSAVLDDEKLGLSFRNEFAEKMFQTYKKFDEIYSVLDRQDKYIYPVELIKIKTWGLFVEMRYFKLGNAQIIKSAVNPEDDNVKSVVSNNEQTLINNFQNNIEFLTKEDALTDEAIKEYSITLEQYSSELLTSFPKGDYRDMLITVTDIQKKVQAESLRIILAKFKSSIEELQKKQASENPANADQ